MGADPSLLLLFMLKKKKNSDSLIASCRTFIRYVRYDPNKSTGAEFLRTAIQVESNTNPALLASDGRGQTKAFN
jgi:hypothetical protein